jgi:hypothetical protein
MLLFWLEPAMPKRLSPTVSLAAIAIVFLILAIASGATRAPWCDEAGFAESALQINKIGRMAVLATAMAPVEDPRTIGQDRYVYWVLPLDIVAQAAWYRIVGFGMVQMRLLATLWGLVALGAWWVILKRLGAGPWLGIATCALIAMDYSFVRSGSEGRMDMMSAALGFAGIAVFLTLEGQGYTKAILAGSALTAASSFTHPIGGMLSTAALGVTILWFSRGRFRLWHPLVAAVPYFVFAAGWGIYILQAPDLFRAQLLNYTGSRLNAWHDPLRSIWNEFSQRWGKVFGITEGSGLKRIRALVLAGYVAGMVAGIVRFRKLKAAGFGPILAIAMLDLFLFCFFENTKQAPYLIYVLPWMAALLAVLAVEHWKPFGWAVFSSVVAIQVAGTALVISRLEYQREYLPAIRIIEARGGEVTGDAQLGFGLGFTPKFVDDRRLGYYTNAKPKLIAVDGDYLEFFERIRAEKPTEARFIDGKLARCRLVFQNSLYKIYEDPDPQ